MFKKGDKVKCLEKIWEFECGEVLIVEEVKNTWDGKTFVYFKEKPFNYPEKYFKKCSD